MEFEKFCGKKVEDAIIEACSKFLVASDNLEINIIDEGTSGFLGFNSKEAIIMARPIQGIENITLDFLKELFEAMNMDVTVEMKYDDINYIMDIELSGDNMGVLIGKRGQTLASLQYITSLVVNRKSDQYIKIRMDSENYRKKRRNTLEKLAKSVSYKVKGSRQPVALEPMNPYERRIIHSILQNDRFVETYSEGEEPYRHVVVNIKR